MILLYIYLGTIALHLIGYFIASMYSESVLKQRGIKRLKKTSTSEIILGLFRIIFLSIVPVLNVILFFAYIFCAEYLAEKVVEKIQTENEEYLNDRKD